MALALLDTSTDSPTIPGIIVGLKTAWDRFVSDFDPYRTPNYESGQAGLDPIIAIERFLLQSPQGPQGNSDLWLETKDTFRQALPDSMRVDFDTQIQKISRLLHQTNLPGNHYAAHIDEIGEAFVMLSFLRPSRDPDSRAKQHTVLDVAFPSLERTDGYFANWMHLFAESFCTYKVLQKTGELPATNAAGHPLANLDLRTPSDLWEIWAKNASPLKWLALGVSLHSHNRHAPKKPMTGQRLYPEFIDNPSRPGDKIRTDDFVGAVAGGRTAEALCQSFHLYSPHDLVETLGQVKIYLTKAARRQLTAASPNHKFKTAATETTAGLDILSTVKKAQAIPPISLPIRRTQQAVFNP
jgi:hypothetical protein